MSNIYNRIIAKESNFSKSFRKLANCCMEDPHLFAVSSAEEVAKKVGVSETTVLRFANFLDYDGYSEFQKAIINHLFQRVSLKNYLIDKTSSEEKEISIKEHINNDLHDLQTVYNELSEKDLNKIVNLIYEADFILTSGFRASHSFSNWFSYALDLVKGNTRVYDPTMDDIFLRVSEMNKDSIFIGFSFYRYAKETVQIAKLAKKQGATTIAFTDSNFTPLAMVSDIVIPIQKDSKSTLDITVILFSILNSIIKTLISLDHEKFKKRSDLFDSVDSSGFYYKQYDSEE